MTKLLLIRDSYTLKSTTGRLYVNGEYFGHTLEDVARAENIKIDAQTAIPSGRYQVKVTPSRRFNRDMPMIFTESNGYEVRKKGVSFKGVRIHGGNTHANTEGCILLAKNKIDSDTIQGSLEKELTVLLKENGGEAILNIINQ